MSEVNSLISSLGRWISPLASGSADFHFRIWERSGRGLARPCSPGRNIKQECEINRTVPMSELNSLISFLRRWISPLALGSAVGAPWRAPVRQAETLNQSAKSIGLCICLN